MRDNDHFFDDDQDLDDSPPHEPWEPPPTIPPPPASPAETPEEVVARFEREFLPTILLSSSKMESRMTVETLVVARAKFLKDAGDPTDPVERTLLDQIFMMHFRSIMSHQYASVLDPDGHSVFMGLAIRMNGEMRKMALALKMLRDAKATTQQQAPKRKSARPSRRDSEGDNYAETDTKAYKVVEERGRKTQPRKAARPVRRGQATPA